MTSCLSRTSAIIIGGLLLLSPLFVTAYSDSVTHPDLTAQAVALNNALHPDRRVDGAHILKMAQGSYEEDIAPRFVNHFYDPITGRGWSGHRASHFAGERFDAKALEAFQQALATSYNTIPSPQWVMDREAQAIQYRWFGGDRTWWRALEYALDNDWDEAYRTLGYVLHLLQDASVPAHVRDDSHVAGEAYEAWAKDYSLRNARNIGTAQALVDGGIAVPQFSSPSEAIKWVAEYTNKNFFSDDTILNGYSEPRIGREQLLGGKNYGLAFDSGVAYPVVLVEEDPFTGKKTLSIGDAVVMSAYWERLSKRAVLAGAATIDLFHNEVERMRRTGERPPPAPGLITQKANLGCLQTGPLTVIRGGCDTVASVPSARNLPNVSPLALVGPLKRGYEELARIAATTINTLARRPVITNGALGTGHPNDGYRRAVTTDVRASQNIVQTEELPAPPASEQKKGPAASPDTAQKKTTTTQEQEQKPPKTAEDVPDPFVRVAKVFDGDTVQLETGRVMRYLSVDTPEEPDGCYAAEATRENTRLVFGRRVRIEKQTGEEQDVYGRLLGYVFLEDGTFVNEALVRGGFAKTLLIPPRGPRDGALEGAETAAKSAGKGVWGSACNIEEPPAPPETPPVTNGAGNGSGGGSSGGGGYRPPEGVLIFAVSVPSRPLGISDDEDVETEGLQYAVTGSGERGTTVRESYGGGEAVVGEDGAWSLVFSLPEGETSVTFSGAVASKQELNPVEWIAQADLTAPGVPDGVEAELGSLTVSWETVNAAAGEEFELDTVARYEIRYRADGEEITQDNWESSTLVGALVAGAEDGEEETFIDSAFDPGSAEEIAVAVRAYDAAGNVSAVSDAVVLEVETLDPSLVISEVQITGDGGTKNEFVELYNLTDDDIDLDGWSLKRRTAGGTEVLLVSASAMDGTVPARGYFLVAHPTGYTGNPAADLFYSSESYSIAPDNTVLLYNADGDRVDAVGFGEAFAPEGEAFAENPVSGESIERKASASSTVASLNTGSDRWAGNAQDTDDNAADFVLQTIPNPQNSVALTEPRDEPPLLSETAAPMHRRDSARSAWFLDVSGPGDGADIVWSSSLDGIPASQAVVLANGRLLVAGSGGSVVTLDISDGSVVAEDDLAVDTIERVPLIADSRVYVLAEEDDGMVLIALDGGFERVWTFNGLLSEETREMLMLPSGDVAVPQDSGITLVDPNGSRRLFIETGAVLAGVAWDGEALVAAKRGNTLPLQKIVRVLTDGTVDWSVTTERGQPTPPVIADGGVMYGASVGSGGFARRNALADGALEWETAFMTSDGAVRYPAVNEGVMAILADDGESLEVFSLDDGTRLWRFADTTETEAFALTSPVIDENGIVYVGSASGTVFALADAEEDGGVPEVLWSLDLGEPVSAVHEPIITAGGHLIVMTSSDGGYTLHAIGEE